MDYTKDTIGATTDASGTIKMPTSAKNSQLRGMSANSKLKNQYGSVTQQKLKNSLGQKYPSTA